MSTATKLFEPTKLGPLTLPNRLVMAPLTRNRALQGFVPNPLAIEYYGQRASAGLLVSEAGGNRRGGAGIFQPAEAAHRLEAHLPEVI